MSLKIGNYATSKLLQLDKNRKKKLFLYVNNQ